MPNITMTTSLFPKSSLDISDSTTNALKESGKCFGRLLYKLPYTVAMLALEAPSIASEFLGGLAGGTIGTIAGGSKILARKCLPRKVHKYLGLEKCKTLKEYATYGFHKGARLAELPGKVIGVSCAATVASLTILAAPVTLPFMAAVTVGGSLILSGMTFCELKDRKATEVDEFSRDVIQNERKYYRKTHKRLYGKDTPEKDTPEKEAPEKEPLKKAAV